MVDWCRLMSSLGEIAGKYNKLKDIDAADYRILLSKGITEDNFQVWKMAQLEQWGAGNGVLTPESIMRIPDADLVAAGFADAGGRRLQRLGRRQCAGLQSFALAVAGHLQDAGIGAARLR